MKHVGLVVGWTDTRLAWIVVWAKLHKFILDTHKHMHICVCIYFYNFEEDPANILQRCSVCVIAAHRQSALSKSVSLWLSSSPPPNSHSLHQGSCAFTAAKAAVLVAVNSVQNFCGLLLIEVLQSKSVFHLPDESSAKSIFYVCSTCITYWDSSMEEDVLLTRTFCCPRLYVRKSLGLDHPINRRWRIGRTAECDIPSI